MGVTQRDISVTPTAGTNYSIVYDLNENTGFSLFTSFADSTSSYTAKTFDTGVVEVSTLTFPASAAATHGDYVVVYDTAGSAWGCAISKAGIAEVTDITAVADVSGSLDGTYFILQDVNGSVGFWIDIDDSGTTIPTDIDTGGASEVDRAIEITTIATDDTAATIAGKLETAIHADSKFTASSADDVCTATNVDLKDLTDAANGDTGFTFSTTTQGSDLGAEPTGAIWTAIPAANKGQVDLSAGTTAAQTAAASELILNALTGFTTKITTDDTAADGTMTLTHDVVAAVTNPSLKNADDSGAGSITSVETTAGVDEEVFIATEYLSIPSHGFLEGLCVRATTTGTLPAGLSLATDYFVKIVDSDTIQLSATQGGSAVNLTDTGTGVHTLTAEGTLAGTMTVQASQDGINFRDTATSYTVNSSTADGFLNSSGIYYQYIRLKNVITEGVSTVSAVIQTKY